VHGTGAVRGGPVTVDASESSPIVSGLLLAANVSIGAAFLGNAVLSCSVIVGLLLIRHRYRLGLAPFTLLFLLFNFNGFITSHLAVGHSMWFGYFLLSFAALFILEMLEEQSFAAALKLVNERVTPGSAGEVTENDWPSP